MAAVFGKKRRIVELVRFGQGGNFGIVFPGRKSQSGQGDIMIGGDVSLGSLGDQGDQATIKL